MGPISKGRVGGADEAPCVARPRGGRRPARARRATVGVAGREYVDLLSGVTSAGVLNRVVLGAGSAADWTALDVVLTGPDHEPDVDAPLN